jgi:hypothetical protein
MTGRTHAIKSLEPERAPAPSPRIRGGGRITRPVRSCPSSSRARAKGQTSPAQCLRLSARARSRLGSDFAPADAQRLIGGGASA